jgi:hypothetical protein
MNNIYIGIDFSINSPSICIFDKEYKFVSFTNTQGKDVFKKMPAAYSFHNELLEEKCIDWQQFNRRKRDENYSLDQFQKIQDADTLAKQIRDLIKSNNPDNKNIIIGIEGYSYGSKGNAAIDLIQFNSTMRNILYNEFYNPALPNNIAVFSPSQIKSHAGKGNANKVLMYQYFVDDVCSDKELIMSNLYKKMEKIKIEPNKKGEIEIPKPIDDIVDAYFICNMLREKNK